MKQQETLLSIQNLKTYFENEKEVLKAVDDVSFEVKKGETLGIVGESGCGKSITCMSILKLIQSPNVRYEGGQILFEGKNTLEMSEKELRKLRGKDISVIFQEPMTALNPLYTIGNQMKEALKVHQKISGKEAQKKCIEYLKRVKIPMPEDMMFRYPFSLSGGMRQRVMIAMALITAPKLIIADEPTTALDVTIQAQILDLMRDLQKKIKTSIIIITHNLGVVANIADRVAVMYGGKLVETGDVEDIFHNPCHEYTKGLLRSIPKAHEKGGELQAIPGTPPDLMEPPVGCPFAARCKETMIVCQKYMPDYTDCGKNHKSACWMLDEMAQEVNSDEK